MTTTHIKICIIGQIIQFILSLELMDLRPNGSEVRGGCKDQLTDHDEMGRVCIGFEI